MTTLEFISLLRNQDIVVRLEGERLQVNAPKSALTAEVRAELTRRKADIIAFLRESSQPAPAADRIRPARRDVVIPLSFAQQRLWFLDQVEPGSAYVMPINVRLRGALDLIAFESSLTEIVRRHEVLRTVFPAQDGVPHQVILPAAAVTVPVTDLRDRPAEERERETAQLASAQAREPFNLGTGPLLRMRLVRLQDDEHVFLFAIHHIVFDGWSTGVFLREFSELYRAFHDGKPSPLPPPGMQYVDFSQWQRERLDGGLRAEHLAYWKKHLGDEVPVLDLPADHPRLSGTASRGARCAQEIPLWLADALRGLSQKEGASLYMVLLTGFYVLLHRLTGQMSLLVGTPVAGRNHIETEQMIGFFVNTVVMRADLSDAPRFVELLRQVRETTLGAQAHQDMPFEELARELDPQRDLNRSPLFQVFFNHLNLDIPRFDLGGLVAEPFGDATLDSKFDVTLYVAEQADGLKLSLLYNADLFDGTRMKDMLAQYALLLEQVCSDPERPIHRYSLVTSSMRSRLPDPVWPLDLNWAGSVPDQFLARAAEAPERIAVMAPGCCLTYAELSRLSANLAAWLQQQEVGRGDVVAILAERGAALVVAILGVLRAQAAFCLLDPGYPAPRLARCIQAANPRAFLHLQGAGDLPDGFDTRVQALVGNRRREIPVDPQELALPPGEPQFDAGNALPPDTLAYVTFTSGTTGEPKCIRGTHRPLSHFLSWHAEHFGLNSLDRFSMLSGLAHDPLLRDVFTPLWLGATLCIPEPAEFLAPGYLAGWMHEQKISVCHLTPAISSLLVPLEGPAGFRYSLPALRYAFFGGDMLTTRDAALLRRTAPGVQIVNFYGTTETPQAMAFHRVEELAPDQADATGARARVLPIGRPIPDVQLLVLNPAGLLAGCGEIGEIGVRTPYLSEGYANDAALTQARFVVNPFTARENDLVYCTGDRGRYRPDGVVEIAGRTDQQTKIRGYRIEPREIEAALGTHPDVRQSAVIALGTDTLEKRLVAFVVPRNGQPPGSDSLRTHLGTLLPEYMIPATFSFLPRIPLTPNGKLDRAALPATEELARPAVAGAVPPRNRIESVIARVWCEILGVPDIGVYDNFFERGGHSLIATRLVARLSTALDTKLPLRSIFLAPTVAGLASRMRYDARTQSYTYIEQPSRWRFLVPIQPHGTRDPLFLVAGAHADEDTFLRYLSNMIPHLGLEQPVYGFKAKGLDGREPGHASVEEMARDYVAEMRAFKPQGPYLIAGECVGGVVAFEMAQQLRQQGEHAKLLVLLDTERPTSVRAFFSYLRWISRRLRSVGTNLRKIFSARSDTWGRLLWAAVRRKVAKRQTPQGTNAVLARIRRVEHEYPRTIFRYRARPYAGTITLIINEKTAALYPSFGWKSVARGELAVHRVPGDHISRLTVHGKDVAAQILACIEKGHAPAPETVNQAPAVAVGAN